MRSIANTGLVVSARAMSCGKSKARITGLAARNRNLSEFGTGMPSIRNGDHRSKCLQCSDFAFQGFDLLTVKINIADRNLRIGFQPGQKLPEADQVCIDGRLKNTSNDSGLPASEK